MVSEQLGRGNLVSLTIITALRIRSPELTYQLEGATNNISAALCLPLRPGNCDPTVFTSSNAHFLVPISHPGSMASKFQKGEK